MGLTTVDIHGKRSRDLSVQTKIDPETLFAVHGGSVTYKSDYGSLSSDIRDRAVDMIHVGSMAYAETWQYSRIDHDHSNYTNAQAETLYGPAGTATQKIGTLSVGDVAVEGLQTGKFQVIDVYCPRVSFDVPEEPEYGTLRFMDSYRDSGIPTAIDAAYIASNNFDGWVFPNGQSWAIAPNQFNRTNAFVTRDSNPFVSGSTLTVPNLRNQFIKLNPFAQSTVVGSGRRCKFESVAGHVALPQHSHLINKLVGHVDIAVNRANSYFKCADDWQHYDQDTVHWGDTDDVVGTYNYPATVQMDTCYLGIRTTTNGAAAPTSYPTHLAMPVMIYVGGRKKAYGTEYLA